MVVLGGGIYCIVGGSAPVGEDQFLQADDFEAG